jgi:hypothetical protein
VVAVCLLLIAAAPAGSLHVEGSWCGLLAQELEDHRGTYAQYYWAELRARRQLGSSAWLAADAEVHGQEETPVVRLRGARLVMPLSGNASVAVGTVEARWGRCGRYPNLWLDSPLWDRGLVLDTRVWGVCLSGRHTSTAYVAGCGASGDGNEAFFAKVQRSVGWVGAAYESRDREHRSRGWVVGAGVELPWLLALGGYRHCRVAPFSGRRDRVVGLVEARSGRGQSYGCAVSCLVSGGSDELTVIEGDAEVETRLVGRCWGAARIKAWGSEGADLLWFGIEPVLRWSPAKGAWVELGEEIGIPEKDPSTYTMRLQTRCAF